MTQEKKCVEKGCKKSVTTDQRCRLHYIIQSVIKNKKVIKQNEKRLDAYIEALTQRYPRNYLEVLKKDLQKPGHLKRTLKGLHLTK